jgi:hypothetical protein
MNPITIIGLSIIFLYIITQLLNYYGINEHDYGVYIMFYIFIILSILILPNDYPTI